MEGGGQAVGLTESFSSWQFDGRSARGSASSCSSKGSTGWISADAALGMPDFRCTSWAQSVGSLTRSLRSSCSSSDSLSSASSGGPGGSASAKKTKQPTAPPQKAAQKRALGAAGGWRPAFGDVQEAGSAIPEGVPPARVRVRASQPGSAGPSWPSASASVPSGLRLEGFLKKKNPHGITWYKRRWAVLDPQAGTLSFFKERWQSEWGFALRTVDVRGYQLCDDQIGRRWSFSLTNLEDLPDPNGDRGAFELVAESQHDFELWTTALRETCGSAPIICATAGTSIAHASITERAGYLPAWASAGGGRPDAASGGQVGGVPSGSADGT